MGRLVFDPESRVLREVKLNKDSYVLSKEKELLENVCIRCGEPYGEHEYFGNICRIGKGYFTDYGVLYREIQDTLNNITLKLIKLKEYDKNRT